MKKWNLFSVLFVLAIGLSFSACDNGNEPNPDDGGESNSEDEIRSFFFDSDGTVEGKIDEAVDSLVFCEMDDVEKPVATVLVTNGEFSVKLPTPKKSYMTSLYTFLKYGADTEVSDNTVQVFGSVCFVYVKGEIVGHIIVKVGQSGKEIIPCFTYAEKNFTMKGFYYYEDSYTAEYNIECSKGWNLILTEMLSVKEEDSRDKMYTLNDFSNLEWAIEYYQ